jgi:hypothetical protein
MKTNSIIPVLMRVLLFGFFMCLTNFGLQNEPSSQIEMGSRNPASSPTQCILFYERAEHPDFLKYKKSIKKKNAIMIPGAQPEDLMKCVMRHNPNEVVLIGQSSGSKGSGSEISYFAPKNQIEVHKSFRELFQKVQMRHKKILAIKGFIPCQTGPQDLTPCRGLQKKEAALRTKLQWLSQLKETDPAFRMLFAYQAQRMSNKPFQDLDVLLSTANINLKRLEVHATETRSILKAYPTLEELNRRYGIRVEARSHRNLLALKASIKKRGMFGRSADLSASNGPKD